MLSLNFRLGGHYNDCVERSDLLLRLELCRNGNVSQGGSAVSLSPPSREASPASAAESSETSEGSSLKTLELRNVVTKTSEDLLDDDDFQDLKDEVLEEVQK